MAVVLVNEHIVYTYVSYHVKIAHEYSVCSHALFWVSRCVYCCGANEKEFIWDCCGRIRRTVGSSFDIISSTVQFRGLYL